MGELLEHLARVQISPETSLDGSNAAVEEVRRYLKDAFLAECPRWRVTDATCPFNRRITCIEWHPELADVVAFASHGGDILLWDHAHPGMDVMIDGEGFGYHWITQIAFNHDDPSFIYATSVNGTFSMKDFAGRKTDVFLDTMDYRYWWTGLAISRPLRMMFVGGNTGMVCLLDSVGNPIHKNYRWHRGKIHYAEFSPTCHWLLATSSTDRKVCLWDMRFVRDSTPKPLAVLHHTAPINSACFDPFTGSQLLTTAQNSEIRVYNSYHWEKPALIFNHAHRQFQHMTCIRAFWHPLHKQLGVVGRYAEAFDPDQGRRVDLVDLEQGRVVGAFSDPQFSQIMVVNKFNCTGEILATGMGRTALLWKPKFSTRNFTATEEEGARNCLTLSKSRPSCGDPRDKKDRGKNSKMKRSRSVSDDVVSLKKKKKCAKDL